MQTCSRERTVSRVSRRSMLAGLVAGWVGGLVRARGAEAAQKVDGDARIRARAGRSEIVISTTNRVAGAIDSVRWGGREFIDSFDHGRQLQSASNFDCGGAYHPETFNPTEAGSRDDGAGPRSSSRLLKIEAEGRTLHTVSQMAFWLRPGEKSGGFPACNRTILSDHLLEKRVTIGVEGLPQAIRYEVTFRLPEGERHSYAQFEALTGYMPAEFSRFWGLDVKSGTLEALSDGPGEQPKPVILATESGSHAMGVIAPGAGREGMTGPGYGRFRFVPQKVTKWNCVYRKREAEGVRPGDYSFEMFVGVGTLENVRATLKALADRAKG